MKRTDERSCSAIRTWSTGWPSRQTASSSSPAARTAQPSSGTWKLSAPAPAHPGRLFYKLRFGLGVRRSSPLWYVSSGFGVAAGPESKGTKAAILAALQLKTPWHSALGPAQSLPPEKVRELVRALDAKWFADRARANRELAAPELQKLLRTDLSPEVALRIRQLLRHIEGGPDPSQRRALRAVELLEHISTPEAKALLQQWAKGEPCRHTHPRGEEGPRPLTFSA